MLVYVLANITFILHNSLDLSSANIKPLPTLLINKHARLQISTADENVSLTKLY